MDRNVIGKLEDLLYMDGVDLSRFVIEDLIEASRGGCIDKRSLMRAWKVAKRNPVVRDYFIHQPYFLYNFTWRELVSEGIIENSSTVQMFVHSYRRVPVRNFLGHTAIIIAGDLQNYPPGSREHEESKYIADVLDLWNDMPKGHPSRKFET